MTGGYVKLTGELAQRTFEKNPAAMRLFLAIFNDGNTPAGSAFAHFMSNDEAVALPFNEVASNFLRQWADELQTKEKV